MEGKEFQEEGAVDGKIPADTDAHTGIEGAGGHPALGAANGQSKDAGQEEGGVKGDTTTDDIGGHTPEGGADAESGEDGTGGVSHLDGGHAKLLRDGGQRQSDALQPETGKALESAGSIIDATER